MATLTGAQGVATGARHGALYCNSDALEKAAQASSHSRSLNFILLTIR
jgi:leucyl aminopeptidase